MLRRALPLTLLLAVIGCRHAAPALQPSSPPPVDVTADVNAARADAEQLIRAQAELTWRNWVLGEPMDLVKLEDSHAALFSPKLLSEVRLLAAQTSDRLAQRALVDFAVYLAGEQIARRTGPLSQQVATLEATATVVTPDGAEHPYRDLDRLVGNERDHRKRVALYAAAEPVLAKLNPLLAQKRDQENSLVVELGWPSARAFAVDLRELAPEAAAAAAAGLLTRSDQAYRAAMATELKDRLGLQLGDTRLADLPRFSVSADLDQVFTGAQLLPRLKKTLLGLGIDLDKQKNIQIDDRVLPAKNPRPICINVQVPGDIRLSLKPIGGLPDYRALFHEAGHAEHLANTAAARFELQQLGDPAVAEAYAILFEQLIEDPLWIADFTGLAGERRTQFVRTAALKRLLRVRRDAAKLLYELATQAGGADAKEAYRTSLERAYGFPLSASDVAHYLVDRDAFAGAADPVRGELLAAQIQQKLVARFGAKWWTSHDAGDLLRTLWSQGTADTVEDVAQRLGDPGLRLEPFLDLETSRLR